MSKWIETNRKTPDLSAYGDSDPLIKVATCYGTFIEGRLGLPDRKPEWSWDTITAYKLVG